MKDTKLIKRMKDNGAAIDSNLEKLHEALLILGHDRAAELVGSVRYGALAQLRKNLDDVRPKPGRADW